MTEEDFNSAKFREQYLIDLKKRIVAAGGYYLGKLPPIETKSDEEMWDIIERFKEKTDDD